MKIQGLKIESAVVHDPVLEDMLKRRDNELKELARKDARHFAKRNLPACTGDDITQYTGVYRASYEKLATDALHYLLPASHFPEANLEEDYLNKKENNLDNEIKTREDQNRIDEYELPDMGNSSVPTRMFWAFASTLIITIGEILFNTKAFQITGENLLFALILSICVSLAVFAFAHICPFLYKGARTKWQRRLVIIGSLSLVTGLFIALALMRVTYLEHHHVSISPTYFVVINLFFFVVSALISFFVLPNWAEVKQNALYLQKARRVKRRNKEIVRFKVHKDKLHRSKLDNLLIKSKIAHHAKYVTDRIRKMYWETYEVFKVTNLQYRTDNTTPECFSAVLPEPDIQAVMYYTMLTSENDQP